MMELEQIKGIYKQIGDVLVRFYNGEANDQVLVDTLESIKADIESIIK